jgi:outer membrane receptor protein involved in Fe transport
VGTPFYESDIDRLAGGDFRYDIPVGVSVLTASYDRHTDLSRFCDGETAGFTAADCSGDNNILLSSTTYSLRGYADLTPKLRLGEANYFSDTTFVGSRFDPRAFLVYRPDRKTAIRLSAGTSYVAPTAGFVSPLVGHGASVVDHVLEVDAGLKPETSAGINLGADVALSGDSKFTIDLYDTQLDNRFNTETFKPNIPGPQFGFFKGVPFTSIQELFNQAKSNEEGLELTFAKAPRVGLGGDADIDFLRAYSYDKTVLPPIAGLNASGNQSTVIVDGEADELPGFQIPGFPYTHGRAEVTYRWPSTARAAFGVDWYGDDNSFGEPGFTLFDFNAQLPLEGKLRFTTSVENIFNHDNYRTLSEFGYGYLPPGNTTPVRLLFAPPRIVTVGLTYPL